MAIGTINTCPVIPLVTSQIQPLDFTIPAVSACCKTCTPITDRQFSTTTRTSAGARIKLKLQVQNIITC